jgi:hypothetical protein
MVFKKSISGNGLVGRGGSYTVLRQRGIAARDSKARRGEYRFMLPSGFCWNEKRSSPPPNGSLNYEASLAARRYELVDPAKRHVARELEARWNAALEWVAELEGRIKELRAASAESPKIDRALLLQLANDLPRVWNAPSTDTRTKQRPVHIVVRPGSSSLDKSGLDAGLARDRVGDGISIGVRRRAHSSPAILRRRQGRRLPLNPSWPCRSILRGRPTPPCAIARRRSRAAVFDFS